MCDDVVRWLRVAWARVRAGRFPWLRSAFVVFLGLWWVLDGSQRWLG